MERKHFKVAADAHCLPSPLWLPEAKLGHAYHDLAMCCCSRFRGNRPSAEEIYLKILSLSSHDGVQECGEGPCLVSRNTTECMTSLRILHATLHCWLDVMASGFPVVFCSQHFAEDCGVRLQEVPCFLDWISDQHALQTWTSICGQTGIALSALHVVLRPPALYASGVEIHAQCSLDSRTPCTLDDEELCVLRIERPDIESLVVHVMLHHCRVQAIPQAPCTQTSDLSL